MASAAEKSIKVYLTYRDVFGERFERANLEKLVRSLPIPGIFVVLSAMSFAGIDNPQIRNCFQAYFNPVISHFGLSLKSSLDDALLYTPQGILSSFKWILANVEQPYTNEHINWEEGINKSILLQMAVADFLYEPGDDDNVVNEIIQNAVFNSQDNLASMIGRTKIIFSDLAKQEELFHSSEFVDFNSTFVQIYGFSIEDYLIAIFGLLSLYIPSKIGSFPLLSLNSAFVNTAYSDIINEFIDPLCFSFAEGKAWALGALEAPWDYRLFREKPLLKLDDGTIIPVSKSFLLDQVFLSLFWKIRHCYPASDTSFLTFYGRPFEIYVSELLRKASISSRLNYEYIPEFEYHSDHRKSPDAMIKLGHKLLVVESKAKAITDASIVTGDPDSIERDYNRLVDSPYEQVCTSLVDILSTASPYDFSQITEYYIITVNQKDFPWIKPYQDRILEKVANETRLPIKYFGHCDIEEFEMLCYLIGRPVKKPIFKILDNQLRLDSYQCLKNFIHYSGLPVRRPSYVSEAAHKFVNHCESVLFQAKA